MIGFMQWIATSKPHATDSRIQDEQMLTSFLIYLLYSVGFVDNAHSAQIYGIKATIFTNGGSKSRAEINISC